MKRLVALLAVASVALGCDGRPTPAGPRTEPKPRSGPMVAVLDLGGGVPEQEAASLLGPVGRRKSFDELLRAIDEVSRDKKTVGVLVKFGAASLGPARGQEIAEQLEALKAAKPVYCHGDGFDNATMMTALRGCSSIYVSPAGGVDTVGLAMQVLYMRRLLADELHLSIDMLQVGKFKGAEEPLTRDGPSPEARASMTGVLADLRKSWLDTVRNGERGLDEALENAIEDGPYSPPRAKELRLVDEVGYAAEALGAVKEKSGAVRERVVFGTGAEESGGDLEEVVRALAGDGGESGPIALLRATGSIAMTSGGNGLLGGRGGIIEKDIDRTLRSLEKDDDVKAVVIRIDSPGGSALASDLIWHHLMSLRKKKPVVFSVGDMAASGGMYLASAGDFIFAEPMSIVGSIGVVGGKIGVGEALEKIGVHAETFPANTSKPGAAARAASESLFTRWDDATRERVLESMRGVYDLFLSRVAEGRSTRGRSISREKIAESAEGRIFSGLEGQRRGLVDEIGGLSAAIAKARELAELPGDARVSVVGGKSGFLDALEPGGAEARVREATVPTAFGVLERLAPDVVPFASSLAPLTEGERSVCAVPFSISVR